LACISLARVSLAAIGLITCSRARSAALAEGHAQATGAAVVFITLIVFFENVASMVKARHFFIGDLTVFDPSLVRMPETHQNFMAVDNLFPAGARF
jgi:hypothetical protein